MYIDQIWRLFEFITVQECLESLFPIGKQIIMTSRSCPEYEITLDCVENDETYKPEWKMSIDPMPYDESTMSDWMDEDEVLKHPASKYGDWVFDDTDQQELLSALDKARNHVAKDFADYLHSVCNASNRHLYPEENENDNK